MLKTKHLSAGYGIGAWIIQRITAIIMLLVFILLGAFFIIAKLNFAEGFTVWQGFFNCSLTKIIVQILVLSIALHAWVGMRDLWMDYVKLLWIRVVLYVLTIIWLVGALIYSIKILWL